LNFFTALDAYLAAGWCGICVGEPAALLINVSGSAALTFIKTLPASATDVTAEYGGAASKLSNTCRMLLLNQ
jgi:hypothetical protein